MTDILEKIQAARKRLDRANDSYASALTEQINAQQEYNRLINDDMAERMRPAGQTPQHNPTGVR